MPPPPGQHGRARAAVCGLASSIRVSGHHPSAGDFRQNGAQIVAFFLDQFDVFFPPPQWDLLNFVSADVRPVLGNHHFEANFAISAIASRALPVVIAHVRVAPLGDPAGVIV